MATCLKGRPVPALAKAGLTRINVSLDTLRPDCFAQIAQTRPVRQGVRGNQAAQRADLSLIKVNCVAMRGVNDAEAEDFAATGTSRRSNPRPLYRATPIWWNLDESDSFDSFAAHGGKGLLQLRQSRGDMLSDLELRRMFISAAEMRQRIEAAYGELQPCQIRTNGPARTYRLADSKETVGFISQNHKRLLRAMQPHSPDSRRLFTPMPHV